MFLKKGGIKKGGEKKKGGANTHFRTMICMQKINFTIHFFLKILQRSSKLVILGNLDMHGHTSLK